MSDQDFFFEEEPENKDRSSKASTKAATPKTSPKAASTAVAESAVQDIDDDAPLLERPTTWAVAILIGVIGLLIGAIGGFLLGSNSGAALPAASSTAPAASTAPAPELSNDQIESGELPAGHPPISTTGTPDATETGK